MRGAPGANSLLDGPITDSAPGNDDTDQRTKLPSKTGARLPNGRSIIFDVSEGTSLDPLQNKSWDLNSPQSVPVAQAGNENQGSRLTEGQPLRSQL